MGKVLIILVSSTLDRLIALGTITLGLVSMGHEVSIYTTASGSLAFLKNAASSIRDYQSDGSLTGLVNSIVNGLNSLIGQGRFYPWYEMIRQAKDMGHVRVFVCVQPFELGGMRVSREDLIDVVDDLVMVGKLAELVDWADKVITL
ncbi:DsrE family protein [Vulcanisaeta thermophila]|uniref:DsrE family protein n=1 Tax=Vulcanisaeta thermophila TaxID=867917 RepID=UPI00085310AF|nr:DsrE family protein [Vulcanisaeta thermophila]